MKNFNLYLSMLEKRLKNPSIKEWTMSNELQGISLKKAGSFAENCIFDICDDKLLSYKQRSIIRIKNPQLRKFFNKDKFITDGIIFNHQIFEDFYIESKMHAFNTSGTANEKLAGFLDKAKHYDKMVLLILGGEFELDTCFESNCILSAAHLKTDEDYDFSVNQTYIGKITDELIKNNKLRVCRLSNLYNVI